MNFTTDLPKKDPMVSYIVASAVKCEKFFPESSKQGPVFRMHAVILTQNGRPSRRGGIAIDCENNRVSQRSRSNSKHLAANL